MTALDRREILTGAAALVAAGGVRSASVGAAAGHRRVPFGAAVNHESLAGDALYRAALTRHCDVLVGEGAMKWVLAQPARGKFDFGPADALVQFARQRGLTTRGHTLVWCDGNPAWLDALTSRADAERDMVTFIETMVGRYKGTIRSWDVVNEPVADPQTASAGDASPSIEFRKGVWPRLLGPSYVDLAFKTAARVDPQGQRVLNEYGIEAATARERTKRAAFRRLVLDLKARDVPVTAIGLQAHLKGTQDIDVDGVSAFCNEMRNLGLAVLVTELDVNDVDLPGDHRERDTIVAKRAADFLGAVFAGCQPELICTWGITDRYTWLPMYFKRRDGDRNRGLPLDADYKPKPMLDVIERYCRT